MEIRKLADYISLGISLVVRLKISFRNKNTNSIYWNSLKLPRKALTRLQNDKIRHQAGIFTVFL